MKNGGKMDAVMKRHGAALGADYYDQEWKHDFRRRETSRKLAWERREALAKAVAAHTVGSVLDLGCGYGVLSRFVHRPYLGVDFSPFVIGKARQLNGGNRAEFLAGDILDLPELDLFDTVAMLEVLEHLDDPAQMVDLARPLARKRIVVSVPKRSYSGSDPKCHVWPTWSEEDVKRVLGAGAVCYPFRRWRIGVWEVAE